MPIKRLSQTSLVSFQKHSNLLAGNPAFNPNSYDLLETTILSSNTASITFSNLGSYSDYKHLQIRGTVKTTRTGYVNDEIVFEFNSDTNTANYTGHILSNNPPSSVRSFSYNAAFTDVTTTNSSNNANAFTAFVSDILDFSNSSKNTTVRSLSGVPDSVTNISLSSRLWLNTAAVTSITIKPLIGPNLVANSRFSLYGVK